MPDLIYQPISATRYVVTIAGVTDGTFDRAVIRGSGFTFDPVTGVPLTGTVARIDYGHQVPDAASQYDQSLRLSGLDLAVGDLGQFDWVGQFLQADIFMPRIAGLPATAAQVLRTNFDEVGAHGGSGGDVIAGGVGASLISGGEGADQITDPGSYQPEIYGGGGNDRITVAGGETYLFGGDGDDRIVGGDFVNYIYGGAGRDQLITGAGEDLLFGDAGRDLLRAGGDDDQLYGGAGSDRLFGGDGDDRIATGESTTLANAGDTNMLYGGAGDDNFGLSYGRDLVFGGQGDDEIFGFGRPADDVARDQIYGEDGEDAINGGAGNDLVYGGAGNDRISGNQGDDRLFGDDGDDQIVAAFGDDRLAGGAGADFFLLYDAPGEVSEHRITDFDTAADRVQVAGPIRGGGPQPAPLTLATFLADAVQVGAHVIYSHSDGSVTRLMNLDLADLTTANF